MQANVWTQAPMLKAYHSESRSVGFSLRLGVLGLSYVHPSCWNRFYFSQESLEVEYDGSDL